MCSDESLSARKENSQHPLYQAWESGRWQNHLWSEKFQKREEACCPILAEKLRSSFSVCSPNACLSEQSQSFSPCKSLATPRNGPYVDIAQSCCWITSPNGNYATLLNSTWLSQILTWPCRCKPWTWEMALVILVTTVVKLRETWLPNMRSASGSPSKKTVRIDGLHLAKGPHSISRISNDVVKHLQARHFMSNPADSDPSSVISVVPSQLRNNVTTPTGHIDQPQPPTQQDHCIISINDSCCDVLICIACTVTSYHVFTE